MEAVIDQTLGHIVHGNAAGRLDWPHINNALVGHHAVFAGVEHRVMSGQPFGDIVRVQDRDQGGASQAAVAHHGDIGPGYGQDARGTPGRGRDRADGARGAGVGVDAIDHGVVGQIRGQMAFNANRPDPRAAAAMRDAEGLVQVEMGHIGPDPAGPADADQGVKVGPVHIDLAAMGMDDLADLAERLLEDPVGRGIGDHQRGQFFGMPRRLLFEIGHIDIAVGVAADHHDAEAGHARAGRVSAMGRGRDQADPAPALAPHLMIFFDHQKARVFALGTGVGLQREGVKAGQVAQHAFQFLE